MSSIRDVAKQAGVSPATVSRILNNNQVYKTSPETRERVLKAVTALDYKPLV
ncbi:MAG: LacI family DNA-binding transcriptional regulator, partial [Clostridia bacterium]|nr:LacI family DNA-binding transcriptional regulator [Clostridia bacterium]